MREEEMSSDRAPDSLVSAWQQQPASGFHMVPSDLAGRIRADARQSRRGFWIGLAFLALTFILFGFLLITQPDPIRKLAHIVQVAGIVFFVWQRAAHRRRVRAVRFDADRTTMPSLTSARAYLETRRAFHCGTSMLARFAVLFPGPPIDMYAQVRAGIISTDAGLRALVIWVGLLAAAFIVQRGVARRYERWVRELDDIERESPVE
jgi:hypothetical protein